jgi:CheY-like chemotaxis protein/GAF domain-containing protein
MSETASPEPKPDRIRVLLVDDDPDFAETAATLLEREERRFEVIVRTDPDTALATVESTPVDAVVSDYRMPGRDGLDLLDAVRSIDASLPFVLLTGEGSESVASQAIGAGVTDYLQKGTGPERFTVLANRIRNAVSRRTAERGLRESERFLQDVFDGIKNGLALVDGDLEIVRANSWLEARAGEPLDGRKCYRAIRGVDSPSAGEACPVQQALETGARQRMETRLTHFDPPFWAAISTDPLPTTGNGEQRVLIQVRDVSDRKRRERKLEKRERLFRDLHEHTKTCLGTETRAEIYDEMLGAIPESLGYDRAAIVGFTTETGTLRVARATDEFHAAFGALDPVSPGEGPLWATYHDGQTRVLEADALAGRLDHEPEAGTDFVAVPIDDYGLILVHRPESVAFGEIDVELLNLCSANAAAIIDRIRKAGELGSATEQVSAQASQIEHLRGLVSVIESIHREITAAETRAGMERTVVSELADTDLVEFAWIGHPVRTDTDIEPTQWAGRDAGLLDAVDPGAKSDLLPAQQAARDREPVGVASIAERVQESAWAKEAISADFGSVASFPIEYDGVLYGVLSVYASEAGAIDAAAESLLADVTALLAAYLGVQNRGVEAEHAAVELEFSISDSNEPLFALARAAGRSIRFETVLESGEDTVSVVVSVPAEAGTTVLDAARGLTKVSDANWFGDRGDRKIRLELDRPFVGTGVRKHGGTLTGATATETGTTATIEIPTTSQVRPLIEWLQRTYGDIELLAKRETSGPAGRGISDPTANLTDRQLEVLEAAYVGGYFDTPRTITGEDLAHSFDISDSAVYKHLRAAQKRLLDRLFDTSAENGGLDS